MPYSTSTACQHRHSTCSHLSIFVYTCGLLVLPVHLRYPDLISTETENPVNELPRKRHCSGAMEECRPFLDLEKMQDQVGDYITHVHVASQCVSEGL